MIGAARETPPDLHHRRPPTVTTEERVTLEEIVNPAPNVLAALEARPGHPGQPPRRRPAPVVVIDSSSDEEVEYQEDSSSS